MKLRVTFTDEKTGKQRTEVISAANHKSALTKIARQRKCGESIKDMEAA